MSEMETIHLHAWVDRIRSGDPAARNELLRAVGGRLQELTSRMLRKYPGVARWVETGDVLQTAALRLLRALEEVRPASTREFYALAAVQLRRELLDLARHYGGPHGHGRNYQSSPSGPVGASSADPPMTDADADLDRWTRFHEAVEGLPAEERETVGLMFYHGWTQAQVAELMVVTERTVQRWWRAAIQKLRDQVGDVE